MKAASINLVYVCRPEIKKNSHTDESKSQTINLLTVYHEKQ